MTKRASILGRVLCAMMLLTVVVAGAGVSGAAAQETADPLATRIRFVQANTDQQKVEIHLNGDERLDEFEYGAVSDWLDVDPGSVRITITEDRAGFNYTIFDTYYPLLAGNDYQFTLTDVLVISGVVDRSPVPDAGARVRVVQGSVALPEVNVVASGDDVSFATQLGYGMTSDYTIVPAGTYDFEVRVASNGETVLTVPGVQLEGNVSYDLVIMGSVDSNDHPLTVTPLGDETLERAESTPTA